MQDQDQPKRRIKPIKWTDGRRQAIVKCLPWMERAMRNLSLGHPFQRLAINVKDWVDDPDENPIPPYILNYLHLRDNIYVLLNDYLKTLKGITREQRDLMLVIEELQDSVDAFTDISEVRPSLTEVDD